jgi:hypothetical protein
MGLFEIFKKPARPKVASLTDGPAEREIAQGRVRLQGDGAQRQEE